MEAFWLKNNCQFFFQPESFFDKQFLIQTHYLICSKLLSLDQMRMGQIRNNSTGKKL